MKTIKFTIKIQAIDAYIYSGHFFVFLENGNLAYSPLSRIIARLTDEYPNYRDLFTIAFKRNDYYYNIQGQTFFTIGEIKSTFIRLWEMASEEINFEIDFFEDDFKVIAETPSIPVLDIKMYAMKMFIGCEEGLFEISLNSDDQYNFEPSKLHKIFDAKTISINAKSGVVFASAHNEGLFYGNIFNESVHTKIFAKPSAAKSLRTNWSSNDIVNYENQNQLEYLVNKTAKTTNKHAYSKFDEKYERSQIVEIGSTRINFESLIASSSINVDEVAYCFNSSNSFFFITNGGRLVNSNILKESEKEVHISSRIREIQNLNLDSRVFRRPLSSAIIPNGCIIEYFDKLVLYQKSDSIELESDPIYGFRTYPNSNRYKNLVSIVKQGEIAIHSLFPFYHNPIRRVYPNTNFYDDLES